MTADIGSVKGSVLWLYEGSLRGAFKALFKALFRAMKAL